MSQWSGCISAFHIFIIVCWAWGSQTAPYCNHVQKSYFVGAPSYGLQGFVYRSIKAPSRVICVRECMIDSRCSSVNFFDSGDLCEFNNATRSLLPENFDRIQGSLYFDGNRSTALFDGDDKQTARVLKFPSCKELLNGVAPSQIPSGVYTIFPSGLPSDGLQVYCDMDTAGGGWTVFQRRQEGSKDFYRNWEKYQQGFGNISGEFWLGNDNLRALTDDSPTGTQWELRIDMEDWAGNTAWAEYTQFRVTGEKYTLHYSGYKSESTAGDSLETHRGQPFSTKDRDNDNNFLLSCTVLNGGAWWYNNCHDANLNGVYYSSPDVLYNQGIQWVSWKGNSYSLKKCSLKIRETD